jgi:hypothetical protein
MPMPIRGCLFHHPSLLMVHAHVGLYSAAMPEECQAAFGSGERAGKRQPHGSRALQMGGRCSIGMPARVHPGKPIALVRSQPNTVSLREPEQKGMCLTRDAQTGYPVREQRGTERPVQISGTRKYSRSVCFRP